MKVLGLSGSLQARSTNTGLLHVARAVAPPGVEVRIFPSLEALPHFNPDLERSATPPAVEDLRARLAAHDAVLIASPEYAHSMPGALKDALDWIVGSGELYGKAVALVSASPRAGGAARARAALAQTLHAQGARVVTSSTVPVAAGSETADMIADDGIRDAVSGVLAELASGVDPDVPEDDGAEGAT